MAEAAFVAMAVCLVYRFTFQASGAVYTEGAHWSRNKSSKLPPHSAATPWPASSISSLNLYGRMAYTAKNKVLAFNALSGLVKIVAKMVKIVLDASLIGAPEANTFNTLIPFWLKPSAAARALYPPSENLFEEVHALIVVSKCK